ncbi:CUE domain protein [Aspergillus terreus]|uniref:CUE domain protein n=1 Tax=Aspergillus terreus TaxID=33178 RepID=A0A5M3Z4Q5_ASPTE|nr:hypothetical protein ATETN484_0007031600 [Aspergillus terreus]GFF16121.1 CUE domain protein [Aspergillus terreus]
MPSHDTTEKSVAARFLHTEVSRLGAQPGLRSLPPGPERDFLTLTWGPIVYRTTYAPESHRLLPLFLRALNEAIQTALHRLPGSREEIHLLEKTYASKVFSAQDQYQDVGEDVIRQIFHNWKVSLALPSIELPVRLRLCWIVDDAVLASFAKQVDLAAKEGHDAHTSGCPIKVLEENFPDLHRRDSNPASETVAPMDRFVSRKRPRSPSPSPVSHPDGIPPPDDDSTDVKLAQLVSLFPETTQDLLLDILVASGGSVDRAASTLASQRICKSPTKRATPSTPAVQTSLAAHIHVLPPTPGTAAAPSPLKRQPLTRKGKTLHLFAPEDVAAHTPCTIIHNFLPAAQATALLRELLDESAHFARYRFQLFDRAVESPHSACVYVSTADEYRQHTSEYTYGGTYRSNVRQITPQMRRVSGAVQRAVNDEVRKRIRSHYPGGKKLRYQSPKEWMPNAAFVNCYDGPAESVGFHADELTYLGPRAIIGSLSLGVEREFRVRRVVADNADEGDEAGETSTRKNTQASSESRADAQGQISIHLPHNSLLVMHAEMQEEWKHAIVPAQTISPHPVSGNRRINITYRWYRDSLHPRNTPRCRCGMHAILRCAQRKRESRGRYMWMCYAGFAPGKKSCGFFQWAEFDDDGEPLWEKKQTEDRAPILRNFVDGSSEG